MKKDYKICFSKEYGYYIKHFPSNKYIKIPGPFDNRLDFAEFFNTKKEAMDFLKILLKKHIIF